MQTRLATVERRSKELAEVFVKYEKANIQRIEVSETPDDSSGNALGSCTQADNACPHNDSCTDLETKRAKQISTFAHVSLPPSCHAMQSFAARVQDKFLELEKHLDVGPQPETNAESHVKEVPVCKGDTQVPTQKKGAKKPADASTTHAAVGAPARDDAVDHDQKGVIFADTQL